MKRKVYSSNRERKRDWRAGFIAFPGVNVAVWGIAAMLSSQVPAMSQLLNVLLVLPWVVNGAVLIWALIFRPYVAVGYMACLAAILVGVLAISALFVSSCVLGFAIGAVVGPLALLLAIAIFIFGVVQLGNWADSIFKGWWSDTDD